MLQKSLNLREPPASSDPQLTTKSYDQNDILHPLYPDPYNHKLQDFR